VKFVYVGGFVCSFKLSKARLKDRLVNKCGVPDENLNNLPWPEITERLISAIEHACACQPPMGPL